MIPSKDIPGAATKNQNFEDTRTMFARLKNLYFHSRTCSALIYIKDT